MDPIVKASNPNLDALWKVIKIAIQCVESKAICRPTMTKVVEELRNAISLQEGYPLSFDYSQNMTYEILDQYGSQMQLLDSQ